MRRISYSIKRNQIKVDQSRFGKFNPGNDVIHDAHKLIRDINFKKIGKFGDMGTGIILAKNRDNA